MGPSDFKTLADLNLEKIVTLGWGIIGWITVLYLYHYLVS
jgi:hypothetical protein